MWKNVYKKRHEFPSSHSIDIKCIQTDITCEEVTFGPVR